MLSLFSDFNLFSLCRNAAREKFLSDHKIFFDNGERRSKGGFASNNCCWLKEASSAKDAPAKGRIVVTIIAKVYDFSQ